MRRIHHVKNTYRIHFSSKGNTSSEGPSPGQGVGLGLQKHTTPPALPRICISASSIEMAPSIRGREFQDVHTGTGVLFGGAAGVCLLG
jgi:hypothetical protein